MPALYVYAGRAHLALLLGLLASGLALGMPWATAANGTLLGLADFDSSGITPAGISLTGLALTVGTILVSAAVGLGLILMLGTIGAAAAHGQREHATHHMHLAGALEPLNLFAGLGLFAALALMAGFGLMGLLVLLPAISAAGLPNQTLAGPASGLFVWWIGIALTFAGTVRLMGQRSGMP